MSQMLASDKEEEDWRNLEILLTGGTDRSEPVQSGLLRLQVEQQYPNLLILPDASPSELIFIVKGE